MASQTVVVIPGDGIGPSITECTLEVLKLLAPELKFVFASAGVKALEESGDLLPPETLELIEKHGLALKGPLTTPIGEGFRSLNVTLRQKFGLYANVRPVVSFPGTKARYENIDILTFRENTEGLYCGEGQTVSADGERAESKSVVTKKGCERILDHAFQTAEKLGRKKITLVHKANILKSTSGLFLKVGREIAKKYPQFNFQEMIVDNCCMQLVMNPHQFDVIVTTNLFGDILSDLCAGLVGGLGLAPGANIGEKVAIFEAVHGSAPDIADKNIANPMALMLAASMLLQHIGRIDLAHRLQAGLHFILTDENRLSYLTPDLGGSGSTTTLTAALIKKLS
jgi:isocitrate dehydrogenase (NAD+)